MPADLHHVVFASPDLAAAVAEFERLTGVRPVLGGRHPSRGTANYLVGLGDSAYLELIGPDPDAADPAEARPFGIDALTSPRLVTWAIAPADFDDRIAASRAAGYDPGEPGPFSRTTPEGTLLEWRLTPFDHGDERIPFLVDSGTMSDPSVGLPVVPLRSLRVVHPEPGPVRTALTALGVEIEVLAGNRAALIAELDGVRGPVMLS
jgi:Glyoxalase-like domain